PARSGQHLAEALRAGRGGAFRLGGPFALGPEPDAGGLGRGDAGCRQEEGGAGGGARPGCQRGSSDTATDVAAPQGGGAAAARSRSMIAATGPRVDRPDFATAHEGQGSRECRIPALHCDSASSTPSVRGATHSSNTSFFP